MPTPPATRLDLSGASPRRLRAACALLVALPILLHCVLCEAGVGGADGWSYFANVESLVLDRDLDLTNNRQTFPEDYPAAPYMWVEETQRWVTHEVLGPALVDAPFYALGRLVTKVWRPQLALSRLPYSALDSRTIVLALIISLTHNLWAIAAMLLVFATLTEMGAKPLTAAGVALLTFFGGPLHYYACNGLSHAPATLAMAGVVYMAARVLRHRLEGRGRPRELFALGVLVGVASVMRYVSGVIAVPIGLTILVSSFADERRARGKSDAPTRSWPRWFGAAVGDQAILALGCWSTAWINLAYWKVQFGHFGGNPHADPHDFSVTLWPPPMAKILFSPQHGFFPFSPVFLFAMAGFAALAMRRRAAPDARLWLSWLCLGSFAAIAFVYDSHAEWAAYGTYSTRFLTECVVLMSVGLWWFLREARWWRWCAACVAAAYSYALFLLTRGDLIDHVTPLDVGQSLAAYGYVFRERVPMAAIVRRIWQSSFSMQYLWQRPALMAGFVAFWLAAAAAVWLLWPRRPAESEA